MMAGILDSRNTKMESANEVDEAIHGLGEHINLEQIWLSTNFSLEFLPRPNAKKKIELLTPQQKKKREEEMKKAAEEKKKAKEAKSA